MRDKKHSKNEIVPVQVNERGYEEHPSYGMIGISQVNVSPEMPLFGSDNYHGTYLALTIHAGSVKRGDHGLREAIHTRQYAEERLIRVAISQAQFAEMITSPNRGDGVPCTIEYLKGDAKPFRPAAPRPEMKTELFKKDVKEYAVDTIEKVRELQQTVQNMVDENRKPNKGDLNKIITDIESCRNLLESTLPFVLEQFEEQMNKVVSSAKMDVDAHISARINHYGLEAAQNVVRLGQEVTEQVALPATETKPSRTQGVQLTDNGGSLI